MVAVMQPFRRRHVRRRNSSWGKREKERERERERGEWSVAVWLRYDNDIAMETILKRAPGQTGGKSATSRQ